MAEQKTSKGKSTKKPAPKKKTAKSKKKQPGLIARVRRRIRRVVMWSFLGVAGFVLLWTLLYALINPPTTPYMFSEGRRPFEAEVEPLPVEEEEPSPAPKAEVERIPPNFKILGVLMETSSPKALLALDDADAKWMQVGETVAAWEISAIGVDWVELTFGTRILVLELFE